MAVPGIPQIHLNLSSDDPSDRRPQTDPDRTGPDRTWASGTSLSSSYHHIIISLCHHVIISSYHHITMASYHHIIMSSCHHIIMSSYHHTIISSYHHTIISSYHHTIISSYHHIITWQDEKSICHFLVNSADRPGIWSNCNQSRLNPGTIGRIRQKMAREFSKLQTAQKSRGWLRFWRFLDEMDRNDPI